MPSIPPRPPAPILSPRPASAPPDLKDRSFDAPAAVPPPRAATSGAPTPRSATPAPSSGHSRDGSPSPSYTPASTRPPSPGPAAGPAAYRFPDPPRPDSPTFRELRALAADERQGNLGVPTRARYVRPANTHEQAALNLFRDNLDAADPEGTLRRRGEFLQAFTARPYEIDFVANHPIHYRQGGAVAPTGPEMFPPGTSHVVHSHPPAPSGYGNSFPSAHDYLGMYLLAEGGRRDMAGMMYHAGEDRGYRFDGRLNPATGGPEFTRLTPSGMKQLEEWTAKYFKPGTMEPKTPPDGPAA